MSPLIKPLTSSCSLGIGSGQWSSVSVFHSPEVSLAGHLIRLHRLSFHNWLFTESDFIFLMRYCNLENFLLLFGGKSFLPQNLRAGHLKLVWSKHHSWTALCSVPSFLITCLIFVDPLRTIHTLRARWNRAGLRLADILFFLRNISLLRDSTMIRHGSRLDGLPRAYLLGPLLRCERL